MFVINIHIRIFFISSGFLVTLPKQILRGRHVVLYFPKIAPYKRVAQSVRCLTADWTTGVRSPTEAEDFSSHLCVQTGSGSHPAFYTVGTEGSYPWGKARPGRDTDQSSPSSAEVKRVRAVFPLTQNASMAYSGTTLPFFLP
jgi:hypothetical protein